ncbi:hypothetical protein CPAV1605_482 [seawater metagenome]|uniref:Major intrinsic protein n=1 Tax=seawater metagenome TaxID=1561972 RepID=A0A5E8CI52_9ZZZZ
MNKYIYEFLGTLIFLLGILFSITNINSKVIPLTIGLFLSLGIYFSNNLQAPGHLNPIVSLIFYLIKKIDLNEFILLSLSHTLAALLVSFVKCNFSFLDFK